MTKLAKLTALCAALLIVIGCVMLGGCHKAGPSGSANSTTTTAQQSTTTTVDSAEMGIDIDAAIGDDAPDDEDDGLFVELETNGTTKTTGNATTTTTKSTAKPSSNASSSNVTVTTGKRGTTLSNGTTERSTAPTTTEKGWSPMLTGAVR